MDRITETLIRLWEWDIAVMSHPWMYIPLLVPALLFLVFFVVKWTIITLPVWIVPYMILRGLHGDDSSGSSA